MKLDLLKINGLKLFSKDEIKVMVLMNLRKSNTKNHSKSTYNWMLFYLVYLLAMPTLMRMSFLPDSQDDDDLA